MPVKEKLAVPGFIDTYTHFLQTYGVGEFDAPEIPDENIIETFKRFAARHYFTYGITTIIDMRLPET